MSGFSFVVDEGVEQGDGFLYLRNHILFMSFMNMRNQFQLDVQIVSINLSVAFNHFSKNTVGQYANFSSIGFKTVWWPRSNLSRTSNGIDHSSFPSFAFRVSSVHF